jgi:hypothetical protein
MVTVSTPSLKSAATASTSIVSGHVAGRALAADDDSGLFRVDLDLVTSEARQFGGEHERRGGLVEVDGRCPAGGIVPDQLADLLVQGEQIADRIPACERHAAS